MWSSALKIATSALILSMSGSVAGDMPAVFSHSAVTVVYYSVHITAEQKGQGIASMTTLHQALLKAGPKDIFGRARYAEVRWDIGWHWPNNHGKLQLNAFTVTPKIVVTLPKVEPMLFASEKERLSWELVYKAIVVHEANHIAAAISTVEKVTSALRAEASKSTATPESMNLAAQACLSKNRQWDLEYDQRTDHGREEGIKLLP